MAALNYTKIYALQDKVLAAISSGNNLLPDRRHLPESLLLLNRRYSNDLDLFTSENTLFRDDVRMVLDALASASLSYVVQVDTRDFVRLAIPGELQVDLVS